MEKTKLRVGLLMDSFELPYWTYIMLKKIEQSDCAKIELIVLNDDRRPNGPLLSKIKNRWKHLLFILYTRLDDRIFRCVLDSHRYIDTTNLLDSAPIIKVIPKKTKYSDRIENTDIEKIKKYKIDIFIRLGFRILRGEILKTAKYGVWSYHHGNNDLNRGGPAGFWEVFENQPVTGSILQILNEDLDNGRILYKSYSATDYLSVKRNRNNYYWKTLSFLPRKLRELHETGEDKFFSKVEEENKHLKFYSNKLYTTPTNMEMSKFLVRQIIKFLKVKFRYMIFFDQWFVMFDLCTEISTSFWRFKKIIPPKDRFWADPHIIYKDNRYYVFIEEFIFKKNKAYISVMTIDEKGNFNKPQKVLERTYHLSYPFVFEWNNEYYMIPETASNRTIEVYKCVEFPNKWEFHSNLIDNIHAVDTTLFYYQQKWWIFTNIKENEGASSHDELFLFYSNSPLSNNWYPHLRNPIVSDIRNARSAGKIFKYNGNIYRPSQNCSKSYGYGFKINQIIVLNENEYEEKEVSSIEPGWDKNIKGVHTFNNSNRLTVIDGVLRRSKFV
jgi:hypothetical protein